MDSENRFLKLKADLNKATIDYSYIEITPCLKEVDSQWESWMQDPVVDMFVNDTDILNALSKGVPQVKRGKIWLWLIKHHRNKIQKPNAIMENFVEIKRDLSYQELLKQSTIHQHSILLDLGRTFPNHENFAKKLGSGQLALFNVLKAYSIMDPEV